MDLNNQKLKYHPSSTIRRNKQQTNNNDLFETDGDT